jgi:MFS family permease
VIASSTSILGISLITLSLARNFYYSFFVLFLLGLTSILTIASINTFLQVIVEDDKRGRVMSLFAMAYMGTVPFGNLFAGCLASQVGICPTIAFGGCFCILGSWVFTSHLPKLRKIMRPVYTNLGLLQPPSSKTQTHPKIRIGKN